MNKEYMYNENNVVVETDKGLEKRNKTNNIVKILETENNIEKIEKELKPKNNYQEIENIISTRYFKKLIGFTIPVSILVTIILILLNVFQFNIAAIIGIPILTSLLTLFVSEAIAIDETKKIENDIEIKQKELLDNELTKQQKKLNKLKKNDVIDEKYDLFKIGKIEKIKNSKLIEDLKRKLELIEDYQLMKYDLIEYSKDHFVSIELKEMGYSESDIEFIQILLEQDIKKEEKQKTLKLEKK